jgi:serine/threonine protein kinase
MFLKRISVAEYEQLVQNSIPLAKKGGRPGILLTPEQFIVKHTYKRNLWSSSTIWPYPFRFKRNAARLSAMGFNVPLVKEIFTFPSGECYLTVYHHLPGTTIRTLSAQGHVAHLQKIPQLLVNLHQQGVYFRDIHTDNLLYQPNQQIALLDITSVKIQRYSLSPYQRARNVAHLLRTSECRAALAPMGLIELVNRYLMLAFLTTRQQKQFWYHLQKRMPQLHELRTCN